jgi:signal transduction histidine kinase
LGFSDDLRTHTPAIAARWEREVIEAVPALSALAHAARVDHLPELLDRLATWLDADVSAARTAFAALAEGHALQRHSAGIDLASITTEYATLRRVILEELAEAPGLAGSLVRLEAGIDAAVAAAVYRYSAARDHVRERFIGILAHDLRDPLTTVMMSATLLADMTLGEKQANLVSRIARGSRRIERMIDDVLDFAHGRIEGELPINPALADLESICVEAVDEARAGGLEVTLEAAGDLRGYFDRDRVRQAIGSLLSNARHYGKGNVRVRAWVREDGRAVFTSVTNRGAIAPERLATIFDPFARESVQGRRGLGLGLYIVEQIARAHGGRCRAESAGDETSFTIEWPRVPVDETPGR